MEQATTAKVSLKALLFGFTLLVIAVGGFTWWHMHRSRCEPLSALTENQAIEIYRKIKVNDFKLNDIVVSCPPDDSLKTVLLERVKTFTLQWREIAQDTSLTYRKETIHQYGDGLFCNHFQIFAIRYQNGKINSCKIFTQLDSLALWNPEKPETIMLPTQLMTDNTPFPRIKEIHFLLFKP
jgi:hypothetical protein